MTPDLYLSQSTATTNSCMTNHKPLELFPKRVTLPVVIYQWPALPHASVQPVRLQTVHEADLLALAAAQQVVGHHAARQVGEGRTKERGYRLRHVVVVALGLIDMFLKISVTFGKKAGCQF